MARNNGLRDVEEQDNAGTHSVFVRVRQKQDTERFNACANRVDFPILIISKILEQESTEFCLFERRARRTAIEAVRLASVLHPVGQSNHFICADIRTPACRLGTRKFCVSQRVLA